MKDVSQFMYNVYNIKGIHSTFPINTIYNVFTLSSKADFQRNIYIINKNQMS